jgi:hypothetical protein
MPPRRGVQFAAVPGTRWRSGVVPIRAQATARDGTPVYVSDFRKEFQVRVLCRLRVALVIVAMAILGSVAPSAVNPAGKSLALGGGQCGDEICGQNHNQVLL